MSRGIGPLTIAIESLQGAMISPSKNDFRQSRPLRIERLEDRRMLAARAADAVNAFAADVYEHLQHEDGNLFYSPISVASALAMTYAGAGGQTAAEMEQVLHLGSEPGIHDSFLNLFTSLYTEAATVEGLDFEIANAMWPAIGLPVETDFVNTIATHYDGHAQNLDYSNPQQAEDTINDWVEDKTHGRIQDLVTDLSPATAMVLTNSVFFNGLWQQPFDPRRSFSGTFQLGDGETVHAPMMLTQPTTNFTNLHGFEILELPFQGGSASMILMLPPQGTTNAFTAGLLSEIDVWLENAVPESNDFIDVILPKFETEVSTGFNQLLEGLGMPTAFISGAADFSGMTESPVWIDKVFHKAFLNVNEQGTEAAAATEVEFVICFAAGTPVLTPDGEKPIEKLQQGDIVLARDEHNVEGELQPKVIEKTLNGHADLLELFVDGKVIRVTNAHPFFVMGQGWTSASELKPKDRLSTNMHDWAEVEKVVATGTAEPVYNLRVADHRTYFVGSEDWGFAVWAHNDYGDEFIANRPFHFLIRDNTTSTTLFMGRIDDPTQLSNDIAPTVQETNGDFDDDGDVDGADFLDWQRGYGTDYSQNHLYSWQSSFGETETPPLAAFAGDSQIVAREQEPTQQDYASDELLDAALALEWLDVANETAKNRVLEENSIREASTTLSQASNRPLHAPSKTKPNDAHADRSEQSETAADPLLADNLIERVFGSSLR